MEDRRDMLIAMGWRLPLAGVLVFAAWHLFATTLGDADGGGWRLLGLTCVVVAGILVAPLLAVLGAQPAGGLFYPRRPARREPGYSIADARRKRGQYEEAIAAYQVIAEEFPAEVYPHVAMMEIAFVNLRDRARADAIVRRGLTTLRDEVSRAYLEEAHCALTTKAPNVPPAPAARDGRQADRSESDVEDES